MKSNPNDYLNAQNTEAFGNYVKYEIKKNKN